MTSKRDYYEVLEVTKTASADEIKKSYRKIAMNIIPTEIREIKQLKKSLKKRPRLTKY